MHSIRTIVCKLDACPEEVQPTLDAFAEASNHVAEVARRRKTTARFRLHKLTYYDVRARYGLSSNLACQVMARVSSALKVPARRHSTFRPTSASYDARIFSFREKDWTVSLTLLEGRRRFGLLIGDYQRGALTGMKPTSATLLVRQGAVYVAIQIKEEAPPQSASTGTYMGVDRGVRRIASLPDGTHYSSEALNAYRLHRHKVRRSIQSKAAKGARTSTRRNGRRLLRTLRGREARRVRHENHCISKDIVRRAKEAQACIVLEDLTGIRERTNRRLRKSQRGLHNRWAFFQLQQFVEYKALRAGVRVIYVDPRYTSRTCADCMHIGSRTGERFHCTNCRKSIDADTNAARVLSAVGAVVNRPEESAMLACRLH